MYSQTQAYMCIALQQGNDVEQPLLMANMTVVNTNRSSQLAALSREVCLINKKRYDNGRKRACILTGTTAESHEYRQTTLT